MSILDLFQGIGTMFAQSPQIAIARVVLIFLGFLLVYLGVKGTLEPLIMVPMGLGMSAVNAGVLFLGENQIGNLIIDPLLSTTDELMTYMQINFLQPIYNLTFSNGLIACLVFMGIGILCDIGYVLEHPFISMTIALFAEMGTVLTYPIARAMGLDAGSSAAVSIIGGADGPMVLFASLKLAPELFVPISIVAYLYLSLTYGGYPYLIKLLIPKELRGKQIPKEKKVSKIRPKEKIVFAVITNTLLCLLFPVAAPLFLSFFVGIVIRETGISAYIKMIGENFLYFATFFLGLMLGVLCDASTLLDATVVKLLILGMLSLLLSGIGGIIGGYEAFFTIFALLVAMLDIGILFYAWKTKNLTVGAIVALIALIENAYTPIAIFNVLYVQYKLDKASYKRFEEFLDLKDDNQLRNGNAIHTDIGEISIKNLSFQYEERKIIDDLSLFIKRGQKIAFVGESGSGKSTVIKILLGLLKYNQGEIYLGDMELSGICLNNLYDRVSYISQDVPVFDGTIKENLVFEKNVSEEQMLDALREVQLSHLVENLAEGLDTEIGEKGTCLSGGEKQRLAFARLWFENPELVVLDEATSAMDNLTEENVMKSVMQKMKDKTVIAIAHRLNSIAGFDRIILFREGKIVGQGTFEELLHTDSYFKELYNANVQ